MSDLDIGKYRAWRISFQDSEQAAKSAFAENADLRAHLAAANKRLEDAEKQEPVAYEVVDNHGDTILCYPTRAANRTKPLYTRPVPPADVAELQKRVTYLDNEASNNADLNNRQAIRIADLERKLAERQALMKYYVQVIDLLHIALVDGDSSSVKRAVSTINNGYRVDAEELNKLLSEAREQPVPDGCCPHCGGTKGHWEGCMAPVEVAIPANTQEDGK